MKEENSVEKQISELRDDIRKKTIQISELRDDIRKETRHIVFSSIKQIKQEFNDLINYTRNDLGRAATEIFETGKFMTNFRKNIHNYIKSEINTQIRDEELHTIINRLIKDKMEDNFKTVFDDTIKEVVKVIVDRTNKKLNREYEISKQLSYSINAEIKHTLAHLPISYNTDKLIKDKIMGMLSQIKNDKKILKITKKQERLKKNENKNQGKGHNCIKG